MEETMIKVNAILFDVMDKIKGIVINILKTVPGETLVTLVLAAIIAIYFLKASKDKVERAVQAKKNKTKQRLFMEELELELQMFFGLMSGANKPAFLKACQSYMAKHNYKMSRKTVKQMVYDTMWVKDNNQKQKAKYLDDPKSEQLIDTIYKFMQMGFEKGPEYEKFQKKLNAKIKDVKIDVNAPEFEEIKKRVMERVSNDSKQMASDMNSQMQNQMMDDMNFQMQNQMMDDMNRHMQEQMMNDMQMQMQMQMMNDMQMQMQMQMMNDMQMQMQMQMMNDMQMQMQQQMMNDMQMQMQNQMMNDMNQQMLNSMNDANMAITSTDFGGHMNSDMNSGNFGMF